MEGKWIFENRVGESIIKGMTEVELIRGEGQFSKLSIRELSRFYPQGKVAIIIYAKPLLLKYTQNSMG